MSRTPCHLLPETQKTQPGSRSRSVLRKKDLHGWQVGKEMEVSINRDTPKWLIYHGKSQLEMDDDWGTPSWETSISSIKGCWTRSTLFNQEEVWLRHPKFLQLSISTSSRCRVTREMFRATAVGGHTWVAHNGVYQAGRDALPRGEQKMQKSASMRSYEYHMSIRENDQLLSVMD